MGTYIPARPTKFCLACNRIIDAEAVVCTSCGVMQPLPHDMATEKRILPAGLLCFFLGVFGAHRFYVGKIGTGLLQLFTLGGLGNLDARRPDHARERRVPGQGRKSDHGVDVRAAAIEGAGSRGCGNANGLGMPVGLPSPCRSLDPPSPTSPHPLSISSRRGHRVLSPRSSRSSRSASRNSRERVGLAPRRAIGPSDAEVRARRGRMRAEVLLEQRRAPSASRRSSGTRIPPTRSPPRCRRSPSPDRAGSRDTSRARRRERSVTRRCR